MATGKTKFDPPAESVKAFDMKDAKRFNEEFEKWREEVGEVDILGRASQRGLNLGIELIYWRPRQKFAVTGVSTRGRVR